LQARQIQRKMQFTIRNTKKANQFEIILFTLKPQIMTIPIPQILRELDRTKLSALF